MLVSPGALAPPPRHGWGDDGRVESIRVVAADGVPARFAVGRASASELFEALLGEPVVVRHSCPACGSDRHGRPWLCPSGRRAGVSIAHADGLTLVGVLDVDGALGVDLERSDAVAPAGVRHPDDPPGRSDLELWVAKEAFLKATGEGLRREPGSFALAGAGCGGRLDVPGFVAAWRRLDA